MAITILLRLWHCTYHPTIQSLIVSNLGTSLVRIVRLNQPFLSVFVLLVKSSRSCPQSSSTPQTVTFTAGTPWHRSCPVTRAVWIWQFQFAKKKNLRIDRNTTKTREMKLPSLHFHTLSQLERVKRRRLHLSSSNFNKINVPAKIRAHCTLKSTRRPAQSTRNVAGTLRDTVRPLLRLQVQSAPGLAEGPS